jgi:hypothetical protein
MGKDHMMLPPPLQQVLIVIFSMGFCLFSASWRTAKPQANGVPRVSA